MSHGHKHKECIMISKNNKVKNKQTSKATG